MTWFAVRLRRKKTILDLWQKCYTAEEIGDVVGLVKMQANEEVSKVLADVLKTYEVTFSESDFQPPIYNVWAFGKKTNETAHFGNTDTR